MSRKFAAQYPGPNTLPEPTEVDELVVSVVIRR